MRKLSQGEYIGVSLAVIIIVLLLGGSWYEGFFPGQKAESSTPSTATAAAPATMTQLQMTDVTMGTGAEVQNGQTVSVLYTGSLVDGTVFDSSQMHGNQPISFTVGAGQVIKGWDQGLLGMKVGGKRHLVIPADLAYGAQAMGPIPANSTLVFDVQLVGVANK